MNVLVVGGCGYIGGALTDLLVETRHRVRVYDALLYEESYRKPVEFIYGDIRDQDQLSDQLRWADVVVWLAALVGDGACALNPEISLAINQEPLRWLAANYHRRIVFMSTCSVYGAQDAVLDETSPTDPLSVYASTKLAAEEYLRESDAITFRLGTLFGVGDLFSRIRLDLVVNALTVRAHCQGSIRVFGGDQFRPLLHVRDAARAVAKNLATPHRGVFNLHGKNVRIIDLAYHVRNHFPGLVLDQTAMTFHDTRNYRVSSDRARGMLGFRAIYSIDEGIEEVKALLTSNRLKDVENPRYVNHAFLAKFNTHEALVDRA